MVLPNILRVATNIIDHMVDIRLDSNGEPQLSGFEGKFMEIVLAVLGRKYQVLHPDDGQWGSLKPDGNWTGIIGMIHNGEADLGFNLLSISEQRMQAVDFSKPYIIDGVTFVSQKPGSRASVFAYFYPFDISIWIAVSMTLLLLSVFCKILDRGSSCCRNLFKFFSSIILQSIEIGDGSFKWKFLLSTWYFFTLVISCAYCAALLSFLTVPLLDATIEDFRQLSHAVQRGTHRCYALKGSSQITDLQTANDQTRVLAKIIHRNNWYSSFSDVGSDRLIGRHSTVLESRLLSEVFYGSRSKNLTISKDLISLSFVAVALSKTFCCKPKLDSVLWRLDSSGILYKLLQEESYKLSLAATREARAEGGSKQLSVNDVSGCLLIWIIGMTFALIEFLWELFKSYFKRRKE